MGTHASAAFPSYRGTLSELHSLEITLEARSNSSGCERERERESVYTCPCGSGGEGHSEKTVGEDSVEKQKTVGRRGVAGGMEGKRRLSDFRRIKK